MNPLVNSSAPGGSQAETSEGPANVSAGINDAFRWNVRPSDKEPTKKWGVILVALIAFGLGLLVFKTLVFAVLGAAIILISTAEFWLGTSYKLDPKGASARTGASMTGLEWPDVKRAVAEKDGIKLSPLGTSSRLEAFRGVFLKYGDHKEQVTDMVRRWLPENAEFVG